MENINFIAKEMPESRAKALMLGVRPVRKKFMLKQFSVTNDVLSVEMLSGDTFTCALSDLKCVFTVDQNCRVYHLKSKVTGEKVKFSLQDCLLSDDEKAVVDSILQSIPGYGRKKAEKVYLIVLVVILVISLIARWAA